MYYLRIDNAFIECLRRWVKQENIFLFAIQKDDRDTAFAQAYLTKAAEALKDDFTTYEQFLKLLYEFGKSEQSPVKVENLYVISSEAE